MVIKVKNCWLSFIILWLGCSSSALDLFAQSYDDIPNHYSHLSTTERWGVIRDTAAIMQLIQEGKQRMVDDPDSALVLLNEAIGTSKTIGFTDGLVIATLDKSIVYYYTGEYDLCIALLQKAIPSYLPSIRHRDALPAAYINLGNAWSHKGDYNKAAHYYNLALEIAEKYPGLEELIARAYTNYAGMFSELDEPEKALLYLEKGEIILRKSKLRRPLALLLYNKAAALMSSNQMGKADTILQEVLAIGRQIKDIGTQKLSLNAMGAIYLDKKQPRKAFDFLEEAYNLRPATDPNVETGILASLSETSTQMKNYKQAEMYLLRLLTLAEQHNMATSKVTMQAHNQLSTLYANMGKHEKAWEQAQRYMGIKDSLMSEDKMRNINQMETKYRTAQKDKEITRKELLISRQQVEMEQNKKWVWLSVSGAVLLSIICLLLYRNIRHRIYLDKGKIKVLKQEQELKILKAAMSGEEKERMRIGRELHDGIGGLLSALKINFSVIRMQNKDMEHTEAFKNVFSLMDEATDEIRKTAHNLMPEMLLKGGITEAIKNFCERIPKTPLLELQVITYGHPIRLDPGFELSLYRIIQELVNNVIRHAQASSALVQLGWQEETLNITIEDNGIGFNVDAIGRDPKCGIGLNNTKARVEALEGQMEIESKVNAGTTVDLEFLLHKIKKAA